MLRNSGKGQEKPPSFQALLAQLREALTLAEGLASSSQSPSETPQEKRSEANEETGGPYEPPGSYVAQAHSVESPPSPAPTDDSRFRVDRYRNTRFWALYEGDTLLGVTVYKRGAEAIRQRLGALENENTRLRQQHPSPTRERHGPAPSAVDRLHADRVSPYQGRS